MPRGSPLNPRSGVSNCRGPPVSRSRPKGSLRRPRPPRHRPPVRVYEPQAVANLPLVTFRLFAVSAVSALALVGAAQRAQSSARPQTTAPPSVVDVKVTITDAAIRMSPKRALRGELARFILVNVGKKPHTFTFGGSKRGAGVQTGFSQPLKPRQQKILLLFLDYRGRITYYGSLAADRTKPGMKGVFTVR